MNFSHKLNISKFAKRKIYTIELRYINCHPHPRLSSSIQVSIKAQVSLSAMDRLNATAVAYYCCCCCLRSVTALFPRGRLPKEDLRRSPLPPRPLVTPGPCCSSCSLSPHTYCHASCIRSVPSPVLLSYTDILPSIWSAPSLSSCPTHIFKTPHI